MANPLGLPKDTEAQAENSSAHESRSQWVTGDDCPCGRYSGCYNRGSCAKQAGGGGGGLLKTFLLSLYFHILNGFHNRNLVAGA